MTTCLKLVFIWSSVWNFPNTRANASISNKLCQGLNTVNSFLIKSCVYWVQWWVFDKDAKHAAPCIWCLSMHLMPGHAFDAWACIWCLSLRLKQWDRDGREHHLNQSHLTRLHWEANNHQTAITRVRKEIKRDCIVILNKTSDCMIVNP